MLFVCGENANRSQMAEGWAQQMGRAPVLECSSKLLLSLPEARFRLQAKRVTLEAQRMTPRPTRYASRPTPNSTFWRNA
ncbi:MAG: hypothetical protein ABIK62_03950 [candidate division WOR-3 bacterium]